MKLLPRSLLVRTFWLIAALVVLTTVAWFSLYNYINAGPRARETAQLAASTVNLIRAALLASAPEKRPGLFIELMTREGIRLLPAEPGDKVAPLPEKRRLALLDSHLIALLGPKTRVSLRVNEVPGFWVSFRLDEHDDDEYWLILPRDRALRPATWHWLAWGSLVVALALAAAWLLVSRINRPLKALGEAARRVGCGERPLPLPETGADELKRLAFAFNRMADDLARHEDERAEVLAGISHDLRTPLTRLRLEAEMSLDEDTRQAVVADIEQMEAIIAQFMDYARDSAGEAVTLVDLEQLLNEMAGRQRALGRTLGLEIAALPPMAVRPRSLIRALGNLIDNAYQYGAEPVILAARTVPGGVDIEVRDSGPGIPPSEAERLKRPFTRLDAARSNVGGTGLGLAIVNRVARLHGGRLELLPAPERTSGLVARLFIEGGAQRDCENRL